MNLPTIQSLNFNNAVSINANSSQLKMMLLIFACHRLNFLIDLVLLPNISKQLTLAVRYFNFQFHHFK